MYKDAVGLTSLAIRCHAKSRQRIEDLCRQFDIQSNTTNIHVTIVDALDTTTNSPRANKLISNIHEALSVNNQVKVIGFECVATKKTSVKLVTLLLEFVGGTAKDAVAELKNQCDKLLQYPLHCTMGLTSTTNLDKLAMPSSNFLQSCQDLEIYLNPHRLEELPSSNHSNKKGMLEYIGHEKIRKVVGIPIITNFHAICTSLLQTCEHTPATCLGFPYTSTLIFCLSFLEFVVFVSMM